jgi:phosphatidylglycerophosphatase A
MNRTNPMTPTSDAPKKKPRLALAVATALGVGYIPKAPGTFGSLVGIAASVLSNPISLLALIAWPLGLGIDLPQSHGHPAAFVLLLPSILVFVVLAGLGVWSATRVSEFAGTQDPQHVVIDEVSGMQLTLILAIVPLWPPAHLAHLESASVFALYSALSLLNSKYLLAGFLLFRLFDIWKPFPIRRLEKLPGGWGIMADDWLAGIYAAICLRVALHFGLL